MQCGGADDEVGGDARGAGGNVLGQRDRLRREAIHFPVSGNQLWHCECLPAGGMLLAEFARASRAIASALGGRGRCSWLIAPIPKPAGRLGASKSRHFPSPHTKKRHPKAPLKFGGTT